MEEENNKLKKATLFTDPFGVTCVKYDLIDIELNDNNEEFKKVIQTNNTIIQQKKALIRFETVIFLTRLSLFTFILFIPTGILSLIFSQLMKKNYLNFNFESAIKYQFYAKLFSYLNILLGTLTFVLIMLLLPLFY
jgi:hypothetical protein